MTAGSRPAPDDRDGRVCEACGTGFYVVAASTAERVRCVRCGHGTGRFVDAATAAT